MTEFRIGAGGWAYFLIPGVDSLAAYSEAFNFVEVNSTFYSIPPRGLLLSWRRRASRTLEFAVRAHRNLTHSLRLEPVRGAYEILDELIRVCDVLGARVLHIQTPPLMEISKEKMRGVRDLLSSTNLGEIRIAWEARGTLIDPSIMEEMRDLDIIHCVDLSREEPKVDSDIIYTRLFGKGIHNIYQFTDKEMKEIDEKVEKRKVRKSYLSFHGVKMYKDAVRMKIYKESGYFPRVTKSTGLESLGEVLSEDTKFPSSKKDLIREQGWKIIDITTEERIRASRLLEKIPDKIYYNSTEILETLQAMN